jgi:hypothetical protein
MDTCRLIAVHTPLDLPRTGEPCVSDVGFGCLSDVLDSVDVVDPHTVAFHLTRPNAQFVALALPGIWIDSEAVVRAAFEDVRSKASLVGAKALQEGADLVAKEWPPSPLLLLPDASQLVARTGLFLPDRPNTDLERCIDARQHAGGRSGDDDRASLTAIDPTASPAPGARPGTCAPVGAGLHRVTVYKPNDRLELTAGQLPRRPTANKALRHPVSRRAPAAKAVADGKADWVELLLRSSDQYPERPIRPTREQGRLLS